MEDVSDEEKARTGARNSKYQMDSIHQTGITERFRTETGVGAWEELLFGA